MFPISSAFSRIARVTNFMPNVDNIPEMILLCLVMGITNFFKPVAVVNVAIELWSELLKR